MIHQNFYITEFFTLLFMAASWLIRYESHSLMFRKSLKCFMPFCKTFMYKGTLHLVESK